jgi:hypothetical protein
MVQLVHRSKGKIVGRKKKTYLLPSPQRLKAVKETDVLEEIREQPETGRHDEDGHTEQNQTEDGHGEEETQQTHHPDAEVPDALAEHDGPQREEDDGKDTRHDGSSHGLLFPLGSLVEPDVVHHGVCLLVLLDLDGPKALDAGLWFGVVVAGVRVDFGDAQREKGEREEFEDVFGGGAVGDWGEEGVLFGGGFGVGGGFEGADGAFDYSTRQYCVGDLEECESKYP